jgi:hypothetical protein
MVVVTNTLCLVLSFVQVTGDAKLSCHEHREKRFADLRAMTRGQTEMVRPIARCRRKK